MGFRRRGVRAKRQSARARPADCYAGERSRRPRDRPLFSDRRRRRRSSPTPLTARQAGVRQRRGRRGAHSKSGGSRDAERSHLNGRRRFSRLPCRASRRASALSRERPGGSNRRCGFTRPTLLLESLRTHELPAEKVVIDVAEGGNTVGSRSRSRWSRCSGAPAPDTVCVFGVGSVVGTKSSTCRHTVKLTDVREDRQCCTRSTDALGLSAGAIRGKHSLPISASTPRVISSCCSREKFGVKLADDEIASARYESQPRRLSAGCAPLPPSDARRHRLRTWEN